MRALIAGSVMLLVVSLAFGAEQGPPQPWSAYHVHDTTRPAPPVVTPGDAGKPPSDAILLFDGSNLDAWESRDHTPPKWTLDHGMMVSAGADIVSKQTFGDIQLHVEWEEPAPAGETGQARGNSGGVLMGLFEIQLLDSYQSPTYPDGQCGSIYGQYPPQVNACRPPGQWQTYNIIFHRPRFNGDTLVEPAYVTVIQNGVLVQDHQRLEGPTGHMIVAAYKQALPDTGPVGLQFHHNAIRFRNVWVSPLEALDLQQHTGTLAGK